MNEFLVISYFVIGIIFAASYLKSIYMDEGTLIISNFVFSSIIFLGGWFSLFFNMLFSFLASSKLKEVVLIRRKNAKRSANSW